MTDLHTAMVVPPVQGRALTTAEFELIRCYALETTGEQLELIGGVLIGEDGPPYDAGRPEHSLVMTRLTMHLVPGLLGRYRLQPAGRLDLPDGSHVMPDLAILPLQEQRGVATTAHAVVEVAASSYARDMGVNRRCTHGPGWTSTGSSIWSPRPSMSIASPSIRATPPSRPTGRPRPPRCSASTCPWPSYNDCPDAGGIAGSVTTPGPTMPVALMREPAWVATPGRRDRDRRARDGATPPTGADHQLDGSWPK
jgi:hypothetical protein